MSRWKNPLGRFRFFVPIMALTFAFLMLCGITPNAASAESLQQGSAGNPAYVGKSDNQDFSFSTYVYDPAAAADGVPVSDGWRDVYCFNFRLNWPSSQSYLKIRNANATTMNHYAAGFVGTASDDPTIRDAVLLVVHNGYPEDAGELQGELTDGQFRAVTQAAVWHFTDNTTMDEAASELGMFNAAFQWTPEMTTVYDKLVAGDGLSAVPDGYSLDLYITNATDAEGMGVQSLLAAYGTTVPSTEKTSVRVTKRWYGDPAESVTVRLFRNGSDTGRSIRLTAADGWSGTFADLDVADANGNAYAYTVKEDPVDGYLALDPTGDASGGFTLANVQTTDIAVLKKWQGAALDKAEVSLLADGAVVDTVTLSDDCDWQHIFTDLPAYDPKTGRQIVYTVSETPVEGYSTEISGNASDGFTVTNTLMPEAKVETTPKTGDSLTTGGIVAAMASVGIAGCVIGSAVKRRRQP